MVIVDLTSVVKSTKASKVGLVVLYTVIMDVYPNVGVAKRELGAPVSHAS